MPKYYKYEGSNLKETEFATKQEALTQGYALDKYGAEYGMPLGNIFANGNEWRYNVSSVNQGVPIVSNANPQVAGKYLGTDINEALKLYGAEGIYGRNVGGQINYHVLGNASELPKLQPEAGADFNIASQPISATKYYKDGKEFDPSKYTNLQPGTPDFENYLKEQNITTKAPETSSAVDLSESPDTSAIDKSDEMNTMLTRVLDSYKKAGGTSKANTAFIQAAAQASKGRPATAEELKMDQQKTLSEVMSFFGLADKTEDLGVVDQATEGKTKDQTIKDLQAKVDAGGILSDIDKANWKYATGGTPPPVSKVPSFDETTGKEDAPITGKSALDKKTDLVNDYLASKKEVKEGAKADEGVSEIQTLRNDAQATADDLLTKIEQARTDQEATGILNEEAQIALKNKIEGQTIPMSTINRQLLSGMEDLSQAQRLERLYSTYEVNSQINQYNAQLRQVALYQGQYTEAMDNVKESVDDWVEMQNLQLQILDEEGQLEKEQKARYESEISYERGLAEQGYVHIPDMATHDKLVKDLNVTADTYSQFFYKDPGSPKIYLKPQMANENVSSLQMKYPDAGINLDDTFAEASAKLPNSIIYQKSTKDTGTDGGSSTVTAFKFTPDDKGRLLAVNFNTDDISNIQSDINEFGIEQTVAGMPEEQATAIRNIAKGVTPTQEGEISEGKRKVIGGINALISDNATVEEINEYIKLNGYTKEDFSNILDTYTPAGAEKTKWEKVKSWFGF